MKMAREICKHVRDVLLINTGLAFISVNLWTTSIPEKRVLTTDNLLSVAP